MPRSLRKGQSSVHLQYENVNDTIGAKNFEVEMRGNVAVLRFTLNPVDGNQRSDEERLFSDTPKEVQLWDEYVIEGLDEFLRFRGEAVKALELEIISRGKKFCFSMTSAGGGMNMLPLMVVPIAS